MALKIYDTLAPQGNYPAAKTTDILTPVAAGTAVLNPETYYQFGEVSELAVELAPGFEGGAPEYIFEFEPTVDFAGLTITPEVRWLVDPQYPAGKKCLVSVCMGLAVMASG